MTAATRRPDGNASRPAPVPGLNGRSPLAPLPSPFALRPSPLAFLLLALLLLPLFTGCGGCGCTSAPKTKEELEKELAEKRAKEKEKPKPNFELNRLTTQPPAGPLGAGAYKSGHWTTAVLPAKTNNFDFVGEMQLTAVDGRGQPLSLPAGAFSLTTLRQVALPKGQPKSFESFFFVPPGQALPRIACRLEGRQGVVEDSWVLSRMFSYQYHFVVLARLPERYNYVATLPSVKPPWDTMTRGPLEPYYLVVTLPGNRRPPLPSHAMYWTSVAYLLWDDVDPDLLDAAQQQALLDWLHWGGQLIVSGPDTLDAMRGKFLAPYLPATSGGNCTLAAADLEPLAPWVKKTRMPPKVLRPWSGVRLKLDERPGVRFVPGTGQLVAEAQVGRGRIVVSSFPLGGRDLTSWPGWDNFVNGCLLARPARRYTTDSAGTIQIEWADSRRHRLDAALTSKLRYFARDAGVPFPVYGGDVCQSEAINSGVSDSLYPVSTPGMAGWNDFSPVAQAARHAVANSARIEIPERQFIAWVLAGYLVILVPVNWTVFRLLGRVEWAWAAAPVIAIVCTIVVIRLAQLDIGFARAQTELAVVEVQGGYSRAHVARYTALYTSLTTHYSFGAEDAGGLVLPFPTADSAVPAEGDLRPLQFREADGVNLSGVVVESNTTGLMHAEEMVDLGGPLVVAKNAGGQVQLANRSGLTLQGAGVITIDADGERRSVWLGTVPPGAVVPLHFAPAAKDLWRPLRNQSAVSREKPGPGELNLRQLLEIAENTTDLRPGQMRLVAWAEDALPGLVTRPAAPQSRHAALVVAHLDYGPGGDPQHDVNTRADAEKVNETPQSGNE